MVRTYKKRTNNVIHDKEKIIKALEAVYVHKKSLSSVAAEYGFKISTLHYHVKRHKNKSFKDVKAKVGLRHCKIFPDDLEKELEVYFLEAATHYVGLNSLNARTLAYELAIQNNLDVPQKWKEEHKAGETWMQSFMERHPTLADRVSKSTSRARISDFKKRNIRTFFNNYEELLTQYKFEACHIYNLDEIGITTAHVPNKIISRKDEKQTGAITSCKIGELVTMVIMISAAGGVVPPMFLFPSERSEDEMIQRASEGSIGTLNHRWITKDTFINVMEHFVKFTECSVENPVLLLLDNQTSHLSLKALKYAKANGVHMLTFPPYCSHKLQPLDRSIFGPLKKKLNTICSDWIIANPGKSIKIQHIPSLVGLVYSDVFTINNIKSGFKMSGIYPFNNCIFEENEYAPSKITDHPNNSDNSSSGCNEVDEVRDKVQNQSTSVQHTSIVNNSNCSSSSKYTLPGKIQPIPTTEAETKSKSKKSSRKSRLILTDTPEMLELEEQEQTKVRKNKKNQLRNEEQRSVEEIPKKKLKTENPKTQIKNTKSVVRGAKIKNIKILKSNRNNVKETVKELINIEQENQANLVKLLKKVKIEKENTQVCEEKVKRRVKINS